MANEIQYLHDDGSETLYCIVRDYLGQFFDAATDLAFEAYDVSNWGDYDIALSEVSAGGAGVNVMEQATFPAQIASNSIYWIDVYLQAGGSPANTDTRIATLERYWNGTQLLHPVSAASYYGYTINTKLGTPTSATFADELTSLRAILLSGLGNQLRLTVTGNATAGGVAVAGEYILSGTASAAGDVFFAKVGADFALWYDSASGNWYFSQDDWDTTNSFCWGSYTSGYMTDFPTGDVTGLWTAAGTTTGDITGINWSFNLESSEVLAQIVAALASYDPPTRTEATADKDEILAATTAIKGATFDTSTDSLEAIRNRGDSAWLSQVGAGAITFTYTLTNSVGGTPIASAEVWVTTDVSGTNVIASGVTNGSGQVTFYLDAGTYYVWRQKSGWNFTNPDTEVVS